MKLPLASTTKDGILTNDAQTMSGAKTFYNAAGSTVLGSYSDAGVWTLGPTTGAVDHTIQSGAGTFVNVKAGATSNDSGIRLVQGASQRYGFYVPGGATNLGIYSYGIAGDIAAATSSGAWTLGPSGFAGTHTINSNLNIDGADKKLRIYANAEFTSGLEVRRTPSLNQGGYITVAGGVFTLTAHNTQSSSYGGMLFKSYNGTTSLQYGEMGGNGTWYHGLPKSHVQDYFHKTATGASIPLIRFRPVGSGDVSAMVTFKVMVTSSIAATGNYSFMYYMTYFKIAGGAWTSSVINNSGAVGLGALSVSQTNATTEVVLTYTGHASNTANIDCMVSIHSSYTTGAGASVAMDYIRD